MKIRDNQTGEVFDIAWDKPTPPTESDIESLKPVAEAPSFEGFLKNVLKPEELKQAPLLALGMASKSPAMGFPAGAEVGKMGLDILTGSSIRDLMNKIQGQKEAPATNPIAEAITRPTIKESVVESPESIAKGTGEFVSDPLKFAYENPVTTTAGAMGLAGLAKTLSSVKSNAIPKVGAKENIIETAEVLPTKLEKTNLQNIATNKFVRDNLHNYTGQQAPEIAKVASDLTKQVKPAIREAQNRFYQDLGIKDIDPIDSNIALKSFANELKQAPKYLDQSAISKAKAIFNDLKNNSVLVKNKPVIPFGKVKESTRLLFDMAEDNVTPLGRKTMTGKFYSKLGHILTEAKKTDNRIAGASGKYADLLNAEKLINKTLRLNREMGEMRLEGKILSSFKDKGQMTFKSNMQELEKTLGKYPETKDIVGYGGFTDQIKLAQIANDIATKKAVTPLGMGRIPGVKMLGNLIKVGDPGFQAQILSGGIKKGIINPKVLAGTTQRFPGMIGGKTQTSLNAILKLLSKGE